MEERNRAAACSGQPPHEDQPNMPTETSPYEVERHEPPTVPQRTITIAHLKRNGANADARGTPRISVCPATLVDTLTPR